MVLAHCPRHECSFAEELEFKEISRTKLCEGQPFHSALDLDTKTLLPGPLSHKGSKDHIRNALSTVILVEGNLSGVLPSWDETRQQLPELVHLLPD